MNLWVIERAANQDICCPLKKGSRKKKKGKIRKFPYRMDVARALDFVLVKSVVITHSHTEKDEGALVVRMVCISF